MGQHTKRSPCPGLDPGPFQTPSSERSRLEAGTRRHPSRRRAAHGLQDEVRICFTARGRGRAFSKNRYPLFEVMLLECGAHWRGSHDLSRSGCRHRVCVEACGRVRAGAGGRALRRSRRRCGRCGAGGGGPLRQRRDRADQRGRRPLRHAVQGRRGHYRAGLEGGLPRLGGCRLERARGAGAMGRPGPAAGGERGLHRDVEFGLDGVRARAAADHGRDRRADRARQRRAQTDLSAQARIGRMDGHDAAHRAAGRLRRRRLAHARRARRRRQLSHHRAEDLHHLWRARPHRQYHPSGAGAAARCAAGHARRVAVPGAEIPGQAGRLARAAQRRARAFDRAQARHSRLAHLHDGLWRPGRRARRS